MANISAIREQLTAIALLNTLLLVGAWVFTVYYTLPKIEEINAQSERTNAVIKKYENTQDAGIPFGDLIKTIENVGKNTELVEIIKKAPDETKTVIAKTGSSPYLSWLSQALQGSGDDQIELGKAKARINTIIPTLSPSINEKIKEDAISLKKYVDYIEQNIIEKFKLETNSPLGIEWINYIQGDTASVNSFSNPIGYFDLSLTFKTTNMRLSQFLDFVKNTGNPEILEEFNKNAPIPEIMSNPLITLESLSIESPINMSYPNVQNSGRITLRLYVRGSSESDQIFLKEAFQKKQSELQAKINESVKNCTQTTTPCTYADALEKVKNKFDQFSKAADNLMNSGGSTGVKSIYILSQQLESLKSIETEYNTVIQ